MNVQISVMSLNLGVICSLESWRFFVRSVITHKWVMTLNGICLSASVHLSVVLCISFDWCLCVWAVMSCVMEPKCGVCGVQRLLAAHNLYLEWRGWTLRGWQFTQLQINLNRPKIWPNERNFLDPTREPWSWIQISLRWFLQPGNFEKSSLRCWNISIR